RPHRADRDGKPANAQRPARVEDPSGGWHHQDQHVLGPQRVAHHAPPETFLNRRSSRRVRLTNYSSISQVTDSPSDSARLSLNFCSENASKRFSSGLHARRIKTVAILSPFLILAQ